MHSPLDYFNFLRELPYGAWSTMRINAGKAVAGYLLRNHYLIRDSIVGVYFKGKTYDYAVYAIMLDQIEALSKEVGKPGFDNLYRTGDSLMQLMGGRMNNKVLYARAAKQLQAFKEAPRGAATDFSAWDLDGNKVKLSDYKGKGVYVDFWTTNCVSYLKELPYIKKMQERYQDNQDLVLLYLSFDKNSAAVSNFLKKSAFTGKHWIDQREFGSEGAIKYNISGLPRYIAIDKKVCRSLPMRHVRVKIPILCWINC